MSFRNSPPHTPRFTYGAIFAALLVAIAPAMAGATEELAISFTGFLYEVAGDGGPDPTPADALSIGDGYAFVGHVVAFADEMLPHVDTSNHEYTVVISGGVVNSRQNYLEWWQATLGGAVRLEVYEDPIAGGTAASPTPNPPNPGVPTHYSDGTLVLGATLSNFIMYWNESSRLGGWSADIVFDEGRLLPFMPDQSGKGLLAGGQTDASPTPAGYHLSSYGETRTAWIDLVESQSWGQLKTRFR